MKNKIVGILIIIMALLIGGIIYLFNHAMTKIVNESCSHGASCTMWDTINFETNISIGIMALVVLIGLYLIFFGKEEKIITKIEIKRIKEKVHDQKPKKDYNKVLSELASDERQVFEKIIASNGSIYQSDLLSKTGFTKVKVSRILDKLEFKELIERKRRGMTNIIILKN
ncbi:MAG: MarR family transcriptional regulator [archaeon]